MNLDNFIVRPQRRLVEKYAAAEAWTTLPTEALGELAQQVAGLPSEIETDDEEAKRFDLLMLRLQLAQLRSEPAFARLRDQVKAIAGLLEEKSAIPMVQEQLALIQDLQTDEWWEDVTVPMLEQARKRIRLLVKFIEKIARRPIYTDFEDQMGAEAFVRPARGFPHRIATRNFARRRGTSSRRTRTTWPFTSCAPMSRSRRPISQSWSECSPRAASARRSTWRRRKPRASD